MKTINKLVVAAAVVVALNFTLTVRAGEPLLSPRAQGNQIRHVSGINNDPNLLENRPLGSPRAVEFARSLVKVSGMDTTDLVHGPRPTMSPRNPGYEVAAKELREMQFQVAQMK